YNAIIAARTTAQKNKPTAHTPQAPKYFSPSRSNTLKPLCLLATRPDSSRDSASGFSLPNEIKSTNAKPVKYMKPQNMSSISNHTSKKPIVSSIFRSHILHNARNRRIYGGGFFV